MAVDLAAYRDSHLLPATLAAMNDLLDTADTAAWEGLSEAATRECAREVARIRNRLDAHAAAAARRLDASRAARRAGAVSTGALLGRDMGNDRVAGNRLVRTARKVAPQSLTEAALERGDLTLLQAGIIGGGLAQLDETVTAEQRLAAERQLIADAARYNPADLRRRADRISDLWAPRAAVDKTEADLLAEREHRAWERTELRVWSNGDGTTSGRFRLPDLHASMLKAVLDGFTSPRRANAAGGGSAGGGEVDDRTGGAPRGTEPSDDYPRRLGHAFCELLEHVPTDRLPQHGSNNVTLAVNIDLASLTEDLTNASGGSVLTDGTRLSPGEVRRLACNARILPQVFGGESVPLDLGREQRLFSAYQRRAIANRDGGCTFPGCDRPPGWCEAHHANDTWAAGGTTDLKDAALVCSEHHRQIHTERWEYRLSPVDGHPEYRRSASPTWQRNTRWRP